MKKLFIPLLLFSVTAFGQFTKPELYNGINTNIRLKTASQLRTADVLDSIVKSMELIGGSFTLTNGNGTTANGSAVDLGGAQTGNIAITNGGTHSWSIQYPSSFRIDDASGNTFNMAGGSGIAISTGAGITLSSPSVPFILNLGSDEIGDTYQRNASGYFSRLAAVSAGSFLRSGGVATVNAWSTVKLPDTMSALGLWVANSANTTVNLTAAANQSIRVNSGGTAWEAYTPAAAYTTEEAQDAVGAMVDGSLTYVDGTPLLQRAALTGAVTATAGSNATLLGSFNKAALDGAVSDGNVQFVGDAPTAHTLDSHSNVTITANSSGELLKWNGSAWINNTLAEAGIQPAGSYLTSEVDGSITNEGSLTVSAGSGTTSIIDSNTSASTGVTLTASTGLSISETGNVITLANTGIITEVDGSVSNELQTITNSSAATTHTVTLSSTGGSVQLVEGSNITLTTTGTGADGIVTIASTGGGGMTDPMTTRGDIIIRNSSNTTARLGVGANTYVLTSDGTDVAWAAPPGGGSGLTYAQVKAMKFK